MLLLCIHVSAFVVRVLMLIEELLIKSFLISCDKPFTYVAEQCHQLYGRNIRLQISLLSGMMENFLINLFLFFISSLFATGLLFIV